MNVLLDREYDELVETALEASVYLAPEAHGLTDAEIVEVARSLNRGVGATKDAVARLRSHPLFEADGSRLRIGRNPLTKCASFEFRFEPVEPRNVDALNLPLWYLDQLYEQHGKAAASALRSEIVAEGMNQGCSEHDMQVAITILLLGHYLVEKAGRIERDILGAGRPLPSTQLNKNGMTYGNRSLLAQVLPIVESLILDRGRRPQTSARASAPTNNASPPVVAPTLPTGQFGVEASPLPKESSPMHTPVPRARVFIGSSSEALDIANAIHINLDRDFECTVWDQGVFGLSKATIEALESRLSHSDCAILVATPDDQTVVRGQSVGTPRDNVIFELGLFIGALGRARTFIVRPRNSNLKLPTDLAGLGVAEYEPNRQDGNLRAALSPACQEIREAIRAADLAKIGGRS